MKRLRFSETQVVGILKEADAEMAVQEICRKYGSSDQTYYNWRKKYGGLEGSEVRRLRELEAENSKLKRIYGEPSLENDALKDRVSKKLSGHRTVAR
ncbi:Low calcium response locus protein S [Candidatus Zixiibacteriota bacterium]|nr:Low calcium response locus protein S [candidate division Zixibacteria bacterium]